MPEAPISIVMPIKLVDPEMDIERLFDINLASLQKYFEESDLREIFLVAGASDLNSISKCVAKMPLHNKVRLLDECELCPALGVMGGSGWFRQQVIKIAAASVTATKYLIAYDDDVIMTRKASLDDLTFKGRLIMSPIPSDYHPSYVDSSCAVLRFSRNKFSSEEMIMSATPEILVTDALLGLQREIESIWQVEDFAEWLLRISVGYSAPSRSRFVNRVYNRVFRNRVLKRKRYFSELRKACGQWTEYSLYWTYLKKQGLTNYYHDYTKHPDAPRIGDRGVWTNEDSETLDLDQWIDETFNVTKQHFFAVYSAKITNVNRRLLYDKIKNRLNTNPNTIEMGVRGV